MLPDAPKSVMNPAMMWVVHLPCRLEFYHCGVLIGALYKDFHCIIIHLRNTLHNLKLLLQNQIREIVNPQEGHFGSCKNNYKK